MLRVSCCGTRWAQAGGAEGRSSSAERWTTEVRSVKDVPYGFVPRPGFRESAVLARWLIERGRGLRIDPAAFASGEWVRRIHELLDLGRRRNTSPTARARPHA